MKPTLRQLEYVVAVAEHASFSRAAEACGVSQPGLSAQVQKLEEELGMRLFERHPRGVRPTGGGERVIAAARTVLRDLESLVSIADKLHDPLEGTVRIGVIPTIAPYLLPRVMPAVRDRFPALRLLIREERTDRLTELLDEGELDLVLVAVESEVGGLELMPLFTDRFLLAVSSTHPLAERTEARPTQIADEDVLLLDDGHCLRQQTSVICEAAGACELGDFRATSLGTLARMVASGLGVTLIPEMAVEHETGQGDELVVIPFRPPEPGRTIALAWRPSSPHGERFRALGEALVPGG